MTTAKSTTLNCRGWLVLGIVLLVVTSGCVGPKQYRKSELFAQSADTATNNFCAVETGTNYMLGIVEIDDQGWLWDRAQLNFVRDALGRQASNTINGVQLFVFVHGWQNNAAPDNDNLRSFREMLSLIDQIEEKRNPRHPRRTLGLYVGWRGEQCAVPVAWLGTFWDSKSAAHEVGRGALTEVLLQTERLVNGKKRQESTNGPPSRLVVIGHSFGGAATYSALAPILMERLVQPPRTEGDQPFVRGFGDLVALINPAFEAARLAVLRDAAYAEQKAQPSNSPPLQIGLTIFTSKEDAATKYAFPLGRFFTAFFQTHPHPNERSANITAVGHYQEFITHDLTNSPVLSRTLARVTNEFKATPRTKRQTGVQQERLRIARPAIAREMGNNIRDKAKNDRDPQSLRLTFTTLNRRRNAAGAPIRIVAVEKKVIPDHGNFDKPMMVHFLAEYLAYTVAVNEAAPRTPPEDHADRR